MSIVLNGTGTIFTDSSGNLGIGTTSPSAKLDVVGNIKINNNLLYSGSASYALNLAGGTLFNTGGSSICLRGISNGYNNGGMEFYTGSGATGAEVMRIDSSGNMFVGLTSGSGKLNVKSTTADNTTFPFIAYNSTPATLFYVRSDGLVNTGSAAASPYNNTTASAANMTMDSGGTLYRSTSSLRYKENVQDYGKGLTDLAKLRPVTFNTKPVVDREVQDTHTYAGFIAEEVHDAGLTEFVQYNVEGQPDALAYANMVALLTKSLQEAVAKINTLETRIAALEAK